MRFLLITTFDKGGATVVKKEIFAGSDMKFITGSEYLVMQNTKADLFTSREAFYIRSTGREISSDIKRVLISPLKQKIN